MVGIHIFQKLVVSARLFMKMATWGFYVLVFDPSGEPANCPEEMACGVPYGSGTEFVVERSTSEEELLALRQVLP